MSGESSDFERRIDRLKADLVAQGSRVLTMVEEAVEAVFDHDVEKAARVEAQDTIIDKADVEIERAAVAIFTDMAATRVDIPHEQIRLVLTIVKVNNEMERIADEAVGVAQRAPALADLNRPLPDRFRVMANSVIGIIEATNTCFERIDPELAQTVLASDDLVDRFEHQILLDMQREVAGGAMPVDDAFAIGKIAAAFERIDDHCTNIAEQAIYVSTGKIVRHTRGSWTSPEQPA